MLLKSLGNLSDEQLVQWAGLAGSFIVWPITDTPLAGLWPGSPLYQPTLLEDVRQFAAPAADILANTCMTTDPNYLETWALTPTPLYAAPAAPDLGVGAGGCS